jgi:carbon storage regulator
MLVLTRRAGESIRIGDDIEVVVRRVAGNRVTVAVAAPRDVRILRGELQRFDDPPSGHKNGRRIATQDRNAVDEPYAVVHARISPSAIPDLTEPMVG